MSARASYYAKGLAVCPNGETITPREKLVLIVLADSHQDKGKHFTYPSIETIAADAMCDRRTCQRYLSALERKGVIARMRPPHQGRGMQIFYFFRELDAIPEGWQAAALFRAENPAGKSAQKGGGRAAEGRRKGGKSSTASITNINSHEELKASNPPTPLAGASGDVRLIDEAQDRVMTGCGWTERRMRPVIRAQIEQRMAQERRDAAEVAEAMVDAWKRYVAQGARLRSRWGPRRFIAEGHWRDSNGWMWDTEVLRDEMRTREARAGSR